MHAPDIALVSPQLMLCHQAAAVGTNNSPAKAHSTQLLGFKGGSLCTPGGTSAQHREIFAVTPLSAAGAAVASLIELSTASAATAVVGESSERCAAQRRKRRSASSSIQGATSSAKNTRPAGKNGSAIGRVSLEEAPRPKRGKYATLPVLRPSQFASKGEYEVARAKVRRRD